ncbi:polyprenyl synthetase family protein [bacterium]|nr:polyprenyl synthetase family protein [bacterium]
MGDALVKPEEGSGGVLSVPEELFDHSFLDTVLQDVITEFCSLEEQDQLRYLLIPAGKRIRPRMLVLLAALFGALEDSRKRDLYLAAASIEFLHNASLVHDDLPALDNDSFRRGRAAAHIRFGEANAVLLGDLLSALAFRALSEIKDPGCQVALLQLFSVANVRVQLGQLRDVKNVSQKEVITEVHALKTGALFEACALVPFSFIHHGSCQLQEGLRQFGITFGAAFQAANDMIDEKQVEHQDRKGGSDLSQGRGSLCTLSREERSAMLWQRQSDLLQAYDGLLSFGGKSRGEEEKRAQSHLQTLIESLCARLDG